jgi:hypothetical protein
MPSKFNYPPRFSHRGPPELRRYIFQPEAAFGPAVTFKEADGRHVRQLERALELYRPLGEAYQAWLAGGRAPGVPTLTELRIAAGKPVRITAAEAAPPPPRPGSLAAMCADYLASPQYAATSPQGTKQYAPGIIAAAIEAWRDEASGVDTLLADISEDDAQLWAETFINRQESDDYKFHVRRKGGHAMAIQATSVMRNVVNQMAEIHKADKGHPNYVRRADNPFAAVKIKARGGSRKPAPARLAFDMMAFADKAGFPEIGDIIAIMFRANARLTDVIGWELERFEPGREFWYVPEKTRRRQADPVPVYVPWQLWPDLKKRILAMRKRAAAMAARQGEPAGGRGRGRGARIQAPATLVFNSRTGAPFNRGLSRLNDIFRKLRTRFADEHYATTFGDVPVMHFARDPLKFDVRRLELGAMRHTGASHMRGQGVAREVIGTALGHGPRQQHTHRYAQDGKIAIERATRAALAAERRARAKGKGKVVSLAAARRARRKAAG